MFYQRLIFKALGLFKGVVPSGKIGLWWNGTAFKGRKPDGTDLTLATASQTDATIVSADITDASDGTSSKDTEVVAKYSVTGDLAVYGGSSFICRDSAGNLEATLTANPIAGGRLLLQNTAVGSVTLSCNAGDTGSKTVFFKTISGVAAVVTAYADQDAANTALDANVLYYNTATGKFQITTE